jgi:hypothetical protein
MSHLFIKKNGRLVMLSSVIALLFAISIVVGTTTPALAMGTKVTRGASVATISAKGAPTVPSTKTIPVAKDVSSQEPIAKVACELFLTGSDRNIWNCLIQRLDTGTSWHNYYTTDKDKILEDVEAQARTDALIGTRS